MRVHLDDRSETLNYRIREGEMLKIPYMAVVGKREAEADSIALRVRGAGKKQEVMPVSDFIARVADEIATRALKDLTELQLRTTGWGLWAERLLAAGLC